MLLHVVLVQLRTDATPSDVAELSRRVCALVQTVAGPDACAVGSNVSEEPLTQGYDFGFVLRFSDHAILDAYHVNPAHLGVSLAIRNLARSILVFDVLA